MKRTKVRLRLKKTADPMVGCFRLDAARAQNKSSNCLNR